MQVSFEDNFWNAGKPGAPAGIPHSLDAHFSYGGFEWQIPTAYCFADGFVLSFLRCVPRALLQPFYDTWAEQCNGEHTLTSAQQREAQRANPMNFQVTYRATLAGEEAPARNGCGMCWQPCLPEANTPKAEAMMRAYNLDTANGWYFDTQAFLWPEHAPHTLENLRLTLHAQRVCMPCAVQFNTEVGCAPFSVPFVHPQSGQTYRIDVLSCHYEAIQLPTEHTSGFRHPEHTCAIEYRLSPPLPNDDKLFLRDCLENDAPIRNAQAADCIACASGIGLIWSSDHADADASPEHGPVQCAGSALHFEAVSAVNWWAELQSFPFAPETFSF